MELFGRQLAWLHQPVDKKLKAPITRMSLRKRRDLDLCLPHVDAIYLLEYMQSLGWCQAAGMGLAPLTATEVYSWCQLTQTELDAWEFEAIRAASAAYCQQTTSDDPTEPALKK